MKDAQNTGLSLPLKVTSPGKAVDCPGLTPGRHDILASRGFDRRTWRKGTFVQ